MPEPLYRIKPLVWRDERGAHPRDCSASAKMGYFEVRYSKSDAKWYAWFRSNRKLGSEQSREAAKARADAFYRERLTRDLEEVKQS